MLEAGLPPCPPRPPIYIRNLDQLSKEEQATLSQGAFGQVGGLQEGVWSGPCPGNFWVLLLGRGARAEKKGVWALGVRGALAAPESMQESHHLTPRSEVCVLSSIHTPLPCLALPTFLFLPEV